MSAEELVRRYRPVVLRFSMRLAGNAADAEDLAQETLLKAVRALPRFEGRSTVDSWLYRIAANAWKNRLRARAARLSAAPEDVRAEELPSGEPTPEAAALQGETRSRLEAGLAGLADAEREVFLLREGGGLSYGEIARAVGVPAGTVKSRLFRARRLLRGLCAGLAAAAAAFAVLVLTGMAMKKALPGLFSQIQGMISGAANTMGSGGR